MAWAETVLVETLVDVLQGRFWIGPHLLFNRGANRKRVKTRHTIVIGMIVLGESRQRRAQQKENL